MLFDDIGQSLIRLSSPALQFQLVVAFLQFLGVPAGFTPPASCLYLAMDENSVFDSGLYDEQPLTFLNLSFSGVSCVGRMDQLGCRRWTRGHSREGEEFIRNIFHLVMPLFSGAERSQLCSSWLRYEIAKVTPAPSTPARGFPFVSVFVKALGVLQGPGHSTSFFGDCKGTWFVAALSERPQPRGMQE